MTQSKRYFNQNLLKCYPISFIRNLPNLTVHLNKTFFVSKKCQGYNLIKKKMTIIKLSFKLSYLYFENSIRKIVWVALCKFYPFVFNFHIKKFTPKKKTFTLRKKEKKIYIYLSGVMDEISMRRLVLITMMFTLIMPNCTTNRWPSP